MIPATPRQPVSAAALLAFLLASAPALGAGVFEDIAAPPGTPTAPLADDTPLQVTLSLPLRDAAGARAYALAVSDRANPAFGRFLTPAAFAARFGADPTDYEAVRAWASAQGFRLGARTQARTTISLSGTAGRFARAFGTRLAGFATAAHGPGRVLLATPSLPDALKGRIDGVIGLASGGRFAPLARPLPAHATPLAGTGIGGGYAPQDIRTAYDIPAQTDPARTETVALFEQGGYPPTDVSTYEAAYGLSVPVTAIGVNGSGTGPVSAVTPEVDLDIDAVAGTNPLVAQILVYVDTASSFSTALVDAFAQIAEDDAAQIVSVSYGLDEALQGRPAANAENTQLTQLAAEGIAVFVSSGDGGAAGTTVEGLIPILPGRNTEDPGTQPLVTSVGGTNLKLTPTEHWKSEVTWNESLKLAGATGGGVSTFWSLPDYQRSGGKSVAKRNGGSATSRNVPDIAADADPYTGYSVYTQGKWQVYGGTSLSSPLWAGMASVVNADRVAAGLARLGFLNPTLYALGSPHAGLHDVRAGNNTYTLTGVIGFHAGQGYDDVTGLGSPDLAALLPFLLQ
jgi:subtilase family serine protease